jgi:adenylate cyclase
MPPQFQFEVLHNGRLVHSQDFEAPIELGRQQNPDEPLYQVQTHGERPRIAIARLNDSSVSRHQVWLEPVAADRVRVVNVSTTNEIGLRDGAIRPGGSREMFAPCQLVVQDFEVRIEPCATTFTGPLHSLAMPTCAPGVGGRKPISHLPLTANKDSESLVEWLQAVAGLLQSAADTDDFFIQAASAVVDLVGLDSGRVLLREGQGWKTVAEQHGDEAPGRASGWRPSRRVLGAIVADKKTTWRDGGTDDPSGLGGGHSLVEVEAVVASPILDRHREVIGVIYGDRLSRGRSPLGTRITKPEAMLMETLASGVAAGLARLEQERAAVVARVQFEQFFSADLARELTLHPDLLEGRDAEVSVLFCDIRGFSRVAEKLGAAGTMQWINDVLGVLSECVIRHQGVLVDYVGDELMAMWGAPTVQADHAQLACRAAVDIWKSLPDLNERWLARLGEPTRVGVGINTGAARVGNTGSQRKFKYGPLGNTVNLASRVQGATKYLKAGMLITEATQGRLDATLAYRRLCQVRVVNIAEPITLYELCAQPEGSWSDVCSRYEEALRLFEQQQFGKATAALGRLLDSYPDDGPSIVLLSRAATLLAEQLGTPGGTYSPVWDLPGK